MDVETTGDPREDAALLAAIDFLRAGSACCSAAPRPLQPLFAASRASRGGTGPRAGFLRRSAPPALTRRFLLPNVTIVRPGEGRLANHDVLVADGAIVEVVPSAQNAARDRGYDRLEEYAGAHVLPGIIDMHAHLPPDNPLKLTPIFLLLNLAHGVTSIRDAGDLDGTSNAAATRGMESGKMIGPRVFPAGPFIAAGEPRWPNTVIVRSEKDAPDIARRLRNAQMHSMKLYENLTIPMIRALEKAAADQGLGVLGHVPAPLGYEEALVPDAQHYLGVPPPRSVRRDHIVNRTGDWHAVDEKRMDVIVDACVRHRIASTPTLVSSKRLLCYTDFERVLMDPIVRMLPRLYREVIWHPTQGLPIYRDLDADMFKRQGDAMAHKLTLTRRLFEAGATLRLGTDVQQPFVVPGASMHEEMELFVEAGIPLEQVWRLATHEAAVGLGEKSLGRIDRGMAGDLLVFRDDPTRSFASIRTLEAVATRGALYPRASLDGALKAENSHHESFFYDRVSTALAKVAMRRVASKFN